MLPNACLHTSYPGFREDVQKMNDHPCSVLLLPSLFMFKAGKVENGNIDDFI